MSRNGHRTKPAGMALQTLETVQARLNHERAILGRWEAVALKNGLSVGTVCRVAAGYNPRTDRIRKALGLPVLLPAPVCQHCGAPPHAHRNCPARRNGHGKPERKRWIITGRDAASIAASIRRQLPADAASRVKELL